MGCLWGYRVSAFPESGRSDTAKTAKIRVRFRPIAVIHHLWVLFFSVMSTRLGLIVRFKCRLFIWATISSTGTDKLTAAHRK